jgi:hypothetical protein
MKKLLVTVKYYNIISLVLEAIVLLLLRDYAFDTLISLSQLPDSGAVYDLLYQAFSAFLIFVWCYTAFSNCRDKRYKKLTGRSYPKDHSDFHRSYSSLVEFFSHNDHYKMDIEHLPAEDWHDADGAILAKIKDKTGKYRLVKRDSNANGNLVSFGLPGSGKSTTQAATTAARFNAKLKPGGCGVFAISIKGDLLNFVNDKRTNIKLFTPDKAEGSCHYNPLEGLAEMSQTERCSFIDNMSIIICPDEPGDNSAFFVHGARDYFCAVALYLLFLHDTGERSGELKFPEIVDEILSANVFNLTKTIAASECSIAGEYSNSYQGSTGQVPDLCSRDGNHHHQFSHGFHASSG